MLMVFGFVKGNWNSNMMSVVAGHQHIALSSKKILDWRNGTIYVSLYCNLRFAGF